MTPHPTTAIEIPRTVLTPSKRRTPAGLIGLAFLCACGGESLPAPVAPAPEPVAPAAPPPAADVTLRFDIFATASVQGHAVVTRHADGSLDEEYEYNDRGRGPKTHAHVDLAADGVPSRLEITGKDYFKRDVHELATCDARCKWDSNDEHGEGDRAFFSPLNDTAAIYAPLLEAATRPGGVPLVGGGAAHAEKVADATLTKGAETVHVNAYELTGFGLTPEIRWFDDGGAYFARVDDWGGTIRGGWNDSAPRLLELQRPLGQAFRERVSKQVSHRAAKIAIVHARLFDPATKKATDDVTIVIEGDKVKAVGPRLAAPAGAETIDARGKTVLPGLWDMHGHVFDDQGIEEVALGVTTVRDMGNEMGPMAKRKARWDAGTDLGPRLVLAGFVDGHGPFQAPTGLFVDTKEDAEKAVATYASAGYVQLKIYSSIKPELVPVLVKAAHDRHMRVSGHIPAHMIAEDAVNAGFDEIQHVNFLMLDVLATRDDDTRTPFRFTRVAEKAADLDLDSAPVKALLDLMVKKHTVSDPTLNVFESMFTVRPDHPDPSIAPLLARLPPQVRRNAFIGGLPVPEGMDAKFKASFKRCQDLVKKMWDRKITLVAGTDAWAGFSLHRELELYEEAGIPRADILAIATLGAAAVMHLDKTSGSIAPGKDADVVIVDGDPLAHMRDVRNVVTVIKGGVVVDAVAAQRALSIAPR